MSNQELRTLSMWQEYHSNGGLADFETFYSHSRDNQKLLVKVARGKALLSRSLQVNQRKTMLRRRTEILNALEKMVEDLYEVGNDEAQYYEEIIGETMDIVMEYDE